MHNDLSTEKHMSDYIDAVDSLDCFDPDDLPEPRDILTGECITLPNKSPAVCYEVINLVLEELEQRAKDLAVPRTSDEANQIWVREVEFFTMFMMENFPLEIMLLGIQRVFCAVTFPSPEIAPAPFTRKVYNEHAEFFS
jgi:hypothetical protein